MLSRSDLTFKLAIEGSRRVEDEELGGLRYVIRCSMGQRQRRGELNQDYRQPHVGRDKSYDATVLEPREPVLE